MQHKLAMRQQPVLQRQKPQQQEETQQQDQPKRQQRQEPQEKQHTPPNTPVQPISSPRPEQRAAREALRQKERELQFQEHQELTAHYLRPQDLPGPEQSRGEQKTRLNIAEHNQYITDRITETTSLRRQLDEEQEKLQQLERQLFEQQQSLNQQQQRLQAERRQLIERQQRFQERQAQWTLPQTPPQASPDKSLEILTELHKLNPYPEIPRILEALKVAYWTLKEYPTWRTVPRVTVYFIAALLGMPAENF